MVRCRGCQKSLFFNAQKAQCHYTGEVLLLLLAVSSEKKSLCKRLRESQVYCRKHAHGEDEDCMVEVPRARSFHSRNAVAPSLPFLDCRCASISLYLPLSLGGSVGRWVGFQFLQAMNDCRSCYRCLPLRPTSNVAAGRDTSQQQVID